MWLDSNTVPIRTVKGLRHARHFRRPRRVVLPFNRVASPIVPQCGQMGPSGHNRLSTYAMAASSFQRCGALRADCMADVLLTRHSTYGVRYVKCNIAAFLLSKFCTMSMLIFNPPTRAFFIEIFVHFIVLDLRSGRD